jgi:hypothetical protein
MKKFGIGFVQVIVQILLGLATPLVINILVKSGYLSSEALPWISLILLVINIIMILTMKSWGIIYTLGWLIGSLIFLKFGLLDTASILVYIVAPVVLLVFRLFLLIRKPFRK